MSELAWVRRGQRLIRMVWELHRMGYQRLRIMPYEAPLAWRIEIAPAEDFLKSNGAYGPTVSETSAKYTAASGNAYFDWNDAAGDTARQLAQKFVDRFPEIAAKGQGRDWAYAGWLSELLGRIEETGEMPFVMSEFFEPAPERLTQLPMRNPENGVVRWFDLPPPGERSDPEASRD